MSLYLSPLDLESRSLADTLSANGLRDSKSVGWSAPYTHNVEAKRSVEIVVSPILALMKDQVSASLASQTFTSSEGLARRD